MNLKHHDYDLKERIINEYINKKDEFISYGIDKLWLFGSIIDGTYYDNSDIDVVITMKANTNFLEAFSFIKKFNKMRFDKNSDVLESEDFEMLNKDLKKIRII